MKELEIQLSIIIHQEGADRVNDATIYGIGNKGTLWKTELAY